jgi:hypothetical protein
MTNDPFVSFVRSCKMERSLATRRSEGSVEPRPGETLFDPDVDIPRRRESRHSSYLIEDHQRLIVNPFLAVLGWVIVLVIVRAALNNRNSTLFLVGLGLLWVPLFLFQYHCLDCGATGWLQSFRRHCCPAVTARAQNGTMQRFPGSSVKNQIIGWFYVLAMAFVVVVIVLAARR